MGGAPPLLGNPGSVTVKAYPLIEPEALVPCHLPTLLNKNYRQTFSVDIKILVYREKLPYLENERCLITTSKLPNPLNLRDFTTPELSLTSEPLTRDHQLRSSFFI